MSKIVITFIPHGAQKFTVEQQELKCEWVDVEFFLDLYSPRVDLSQFYMRVSLSGPDGDLHQWEFPEPGFSLESTDDSFLWSTRTSLRPDTSYSLSVEAQLRADQGPQSVQTSLHTPYAERLYDSWNWDPVTKTWIPPVAKPGLNFVWSEDLYQSNQYPWVETPLGEY